VEVSGVKGQKRTEQPVLPEVTEVGKFYTPDQIAQMLQVAPRTILDWIKKGRLRALRFGRGWRIKASDLAAFVERAEKAAGGGDSDQ
jgi:excisionase family DNA binding protein